MGHTEADLKVYSGFYRIQKAIKAEGSKVDMENSLGNQ